MVFGLKEDFAIECYLHNVPVMRKHLVLGRMCVWCGGHQIGDIDDINVLNVPEGPFHGLLLSLDERHDEAVDFLSDHAAFEFLDAVLYGEDDRSMEELTAHADRFSKFDFLTNWGESFDHIKAFLLHSGDDLRVLFRHDSEPVAGRRVTEQGLRLAVQGFLAWIEGQRRSGDVTEAEWLASEDVEGMLDWLHRSDPTLSENRGRKLRLFACACCRRVWSILTDERSRRAVEIAERFTDGMASEDELAAACQGAKDAASAVQRRHGSYAAKGYAAWAAVYAAYETPAASAAYNTRAAIHFSTGGDVTLGQRETAAQVAMLRDIFGNPFRTISLARTCLTPPVLAAAEAIYNDRAFHRLPELADLLERAGCDNADVLGHCRSCSEHIRGCWVVDLVRTKA